jgi:hypothetical protein
MRRVVVKVGQRVRTWSVAVALAGAVVACVAPSEPPGGGGTTSTTAPTATSTAPTTTTTQVPTPSTTDTTAAPPTTLVTEPPDPPAGGAFSEGISISEEGYDSSMPDVAFGRQGNALVTWVRTSHDYPYRYQLEARFRSHDATWGPIIVVSAEGAPRNPTAALDDDGDAVLVWNGSGTDVRAFARRVSSTGALGPLQVLSEAGTQAHGTSVAVDSDGDAILTWAEYQSDGSTIPKMRRFTKDGMLAPALVLSSSPSRAETPAVAFDRDGDAILAWANDHVVQARTLTASGTLGELQTVTGDVSRIDRQGLVRLTIDRDGDALVTWRHNVAADGSDQVWGRWLSRDGALGALRQLSSASHPDVQNHSVAGDLDGNVILTWNRFPSGELYAREISPAGVVGEPVLLSSYAVTNWVHLDDDGDGVVVWHGEGVDGTAASVRALRVTRAGGFEDPEAVAPAGKYPVAAVSPDGDAIIAWERRFQVDLRIQVSVAT